MIASSFEELSDEDLASICAERPVRENAWLEFYRRFKIPIRNEVMRTLKGFPGETEDLVQTAFLQVFRALPRYDRSRSRIRTFIAPVVANAVIDVLRHGRQAYSSVASLDIELTRLQHRGESDPLLVQQLSVTIVDRLRDNRKIQIVNDLLEGIEVKNICATREANPSEVYTARRWLFQLIREIGAGIR